MSKAKVPTVVSNTEFNTVVETKISRKELVEMILEEQEAQLEDAQDEAAKAQEEAYRINNKAKEDFCSIAETEALKMPKTKEFIKNLNKCFSSERVSVFVDMNYYDLVREAYGEEQKACKKKPTKNAASICFRIKSASKHDYDMQGIAFSLSLNDLMANKKVQKAFQIANDTNKKYMDAEEALEEIANKFHDFKRKGKRAKTSFTRELLKGTEEGKAILAKLDNIKDNTQKLLK